jgi:hypothetical protein
LFLQPEKCLGFTKGVQLTVCKASAWASRALARG